MDDSWTEGLAVATTVGTGLMAGLFFAFSVVFMQSLDSLPGTQGMHAMQIINDKIQNPVFLTVFVGTTLATVVMGGLAIFKLDGTARWWVLAGAVLYLVGVFLLTGGYHIPRNDHLATVDVNSADAAKEWATYIKEWVPMNHVRTLASIASFGSFVMALRVG
jgi:uncharacterized membrane protein